MTEEIDYKEQFIQLRYLFVRYKNAQRHLKESDKPETKQFWLDLISKLEEKMQSFLKVEPY